MYHIVHVNDMDFENPIFELVPIVNYFPEVFRANLLGVLSLFFPIEWTRQNLKS